jgi:alanine dehydrogenase
VTTHSDPTFVVHDVVHYWVGNMPGAVPITSTYALTNVTLPYAVRIASMGLEEAVRAWESSEIARSCFGPDTVRHQAAAGRAELAAFSASVTDLERRRHFERG